MSLSPLVRAVVVFIVACRARVSTEHCPTLPRSEGEHVYLEQVYRRPRFLFLPTVALRSLLQMNAAYNCEISGECFVASLPLMGFHLLRIYISNRDKSRRKQNTSKNIWGYAYMGVRDLRPSDKAWGSRLCGQICT